MTGIIFRRDVTLPSGRSYRKGEFVEFESVHEARSWIDCGFAKLASEPEPRARDEKAAARSAARSAERSAARRAVPRHGETRVIDHPGSHVRGVGPMAEIRG